MIRIFCAVTAMTLATAAACTSPTSLEPIDAGVIWTPREFTFAGDAAFTVDLLGQVLKIPNGSDVAQVIVPAYRTRQLNEIPVEATAFRIANTDTELFWTYWRDGKSQLWSRALQGGQPQLRFNGDFPIYALAAAKDRVCWADRKESLRDSIRCLTTNQAESSVVGLAVPHIVGLAFVDSRHLAIASQGVQTWRIADGVISVLDLESGAMQQIADQQPAPAAIWTGGEHIVWRNGGVCQIPNPFGCSLTPGDLKEWHPGSNEVRRVTTTSSACVTVDQQAIWLMENGLNLAKYNFSGGLAIHRFTEPGVYCDALAKNGNSFFVSADRQLFQTSLND
jgi:hypothetical protein